VYLPRHFARRLGRTGGQRPWKMGDSSPQYIDELLAGIVGVEIAVTKSAIAREMLKAD
jgi:predicted FMN-binding regulatory protein PaiB